MISNLPSYSRLVVIAVICLTCAKASADQVVNVYSARHYDTDITLYNEFKEQTGIKVNLIEAASDTLISRVINEGKHSPADVLITVDAGRLVRAEQAGLFRPTESDILAQRIPDHLRHPAGLWFGLSKRARVIIYNVAKGKPEGLDDYEDLANPKFAGQICVRSSSNIYNISMLSALIGHLGEEAAERWAQGVADNFRRRPQGNDTANIRAVAAGECQMSIVNSYYIARMLANQDPLGQMVGIVYPNQKSTGTHINISGAGILKHSPNRDNAIRFLEYLTESDAQFMYVAGNNEYPVVVGAKTTDVMDSLGTFKEDEINATELGRHQAAAVRIFDRVGWN